MPLSVTRKVAEAAKRMLEVFVWISFVFEFHDSLWLVLVFFLKDVRQSVDIKQKHTWNPPCCHVVCMKSTFQGLCTNTDWQHQFLIFQGSMVTLPDWGNKTSIRVSHDVTKQDKCRIVFVIMVQKANLEPRSDTDKTLQQWRATELLRSFPLVWSQRWWVLWTHWCPCHMIPHVWTFSDISLVLFWVQPVNNVSPVLHHRCLEMFCCSYMLSELHRQFHVY